jgi:hypothetical protein
LKAGIRPFGGVVAVNSAVKQELESLDLKGLVLSAIPVRGNIKESQPVWRLQSSVILPESPIPLKHSDGTPFAGDYTKGCLYRGCYREVELAYQTCDLASLGHVDFAVTAEITGNYPGGCFRGLVISQRVRRIFQQMKLRGVHFTPVRLLEDGEPPIRDPLAELLKAER